MHVPAGHRFPDAIGVAFASAWARHRCLQLYFNFVSFTFLCCDDIEYILDTNCVLHTKLYVINIISTFYKPGVF